MNLEKPPSAGSATEPPRRLHPIPTSYVAVLALLLTWNTVMTLLGKSEQAVVFMLVATTIAVVTLAGMRIAAKPLMRALTLLNAIALTAQEQTPQHGAAAADPAPGSSRELPPPAEGGAL